MKCYKYYDVSKIVENMQKNKEIDCYPIGDNKFCGVFVCMDTNDFWIARINKGYNEDYEKEEGKFLVERNRISIYDVMDRLHELHSKKLPNFEETDSQYELKNKCHYYLNKFKERDIIQAVVYLDDFDGLSNWDCYETNSLEEAIDTIDGGFGILNIA